MSTYCFHFRHSTASGVLEFPYSLVFKQALIVSMRKEVANWE